MDGSVERSPLSISREVAGPRDRIVVMSPDGYLDGDTYPEFDRALQAEVGIGTRFLVMDFKRISYLNSMSWGLLAGMQRRLKLAAGELVVAGMSEAVASVYTMMGFARMLRSFPDADAAVAEIAKTLSE